MDILKAARARERADRLAALRDGRRQRSNKFKTGKDYKRKPKHGKDWRGQQ